MENKFNVMPCRWHCEFDEYGKITKIVYSEKYRRVFGVEEKEVDANNLASWNSNIHPEDGPQVYQYILKTLDNDDKYIDFDVEYRMMTDKGYRWVHASAEIIRNDNGIMESMEGTTLDIHETLRNKKMLETQLDSVYELVDAARWQWKYDEEGNIYDVFWSDSYRKLLGFESTEDFPNTVEA